MALNDSRGYSDSYENIALTSINYENNFKTNVFVNVQMLAKVNVPFYVIKAAITSPDQENCH